MRSLTKGKNNETQPGVHYLFASILMFLQTMTGMTLSGKTLIPSGLHLRFLKVLYARSNFYYKWLFESALMRSLTKGKNNETQPGIQYLLASL